MVSILDLVNVLMDYPIFIANNQYFALHDDIPYEQQCRALANDIKRIHALSSEHYASFEALINQYLKAGLEIFSMETGIVSHINSSACTYRVEAVVSPLDVLSVGDIFELKDTYCHEVVQTKQVIGFPQVGKHPDMCLHPVYQNLKLEAYLSAPIWLEKELFGTLNFTSRVPRQHGFSEHEQDLIALLASSIGNFLMLQQKEQALQKANERLKMFIGYVSHDLRNPLGTIKNMASMGLKRGPETGRIHEIFQRIENSSENALELVSSILDVAALGTGNLHLNCDMENLSKLLRDALAEINPLAELQQLSFSIDVNPDTEVWVDALRIKQVLLNLLNNACKYAPSGSQINIFSEPNKDGIEFGICNGVAPEFSANAETLLPSTGFGLQIVREVLQAHKSELTIDNSNNTFCAKCTLHSKQ